MWFWVQINSSLLFGENCEILKILKNLREVTLRDHSRSPPKRVENGSKKGLFFEYLIDTFEILKKNIPPTPYKDKLVL